MQIMSESRLIPAKKKKNHNTNIHKGLSTCGQLTVSHSTSKYREYGKCRLGYIFKLTLAASDLCGGRVERVKVNQIQQTAEPLFHMLRVSCRLSNNV